MSNKEYKNLAIFCLIASTFIGLMPIFTNGESELVFHPEDWRISFIFSSLSFLLFYALGVFFISETNDIERINIENDKIEKSNNEWKKRNNKQKKINEEYRQRIYKDFMTKMDKKL